MNHVLLSAAPSTIDACLHPLDLAQPPSPSLTLPHPPFPFPTEQI